MKAGSLLGTFIGGLVFGALMVLVIQANSPKEQNAETATPLATAPGPKKVEKEEPSAKPTTNAPSSKVDLPLAKTAPSVDASPAVPELTAEEKQLKRIQALAAKGDLEDALRTSWSLQWDEKKQDILQLEYSLLEKVLKAYTTQGSYTEALDFCNQFLTYHPWDQIGVLNKAKLLLDTGKPYDAWKLCNDAFLYSTETTGNTKLTKASQKIVTEAETFYTNQKSWAELIKLYERLIASDIENTNAYRMKQARAHIALTQWRKALDQLTLLSIDPTHAQQAEKLIAYIGTKTQTTDEVVDSFTIPLIRKGDALYVDAELNGTTFRMLLDTGATMTHLLPATAEACGITNQDHIETRTFLTAGGKIRAPIAQLNSVALSDATSIENVQVAIHPLSHFEPDLGGILGMNYLMKFRFTVDIENSTLTLTSK